MLREMYKARGVEFLGVHIDPRLTSEEVVSHAKEYKIQYALTIDKSHRLVSALGAKITPEVFVLNRSGAVVYRGRVDDTYVEIGVRRSRVTKHDLADAIEATLIGKKPKVERTEAVGCIIPKLSDFDGVRA